MADQYTPGSKLAAMDMQLVAAQSESEHRIWHSSVAQPTSERIAALISDADLLMDTLLDYRQSLVRIHQFLVANEEHPAVRKSKP